MRAFLDGEEEELNMFLRLCNLRIAAFRGQPETAESFAVIHRLRSHRRRAIRAMLQSRTREEEGKFECLQRIRKLKSDLEKLPTPTTRQICRLLVATRARDELVETLLPFKKRPGIRCASTYRGGAR